MKALTNKRAKAIGMAALIAGLVAQAEATLPPVGGYSWWLDASSNSFTFSSGNLISTWKDLSASPVNINQTVVAQQPTLVSNVLNGLPVVRFDGNPLAAQGDELFNGGSSPFVGGIHSVFMVLKLAKPTIEQEVLAANTGGLTSRFIYLESDGVKILRGGGGSPIVNNSYNAGDYKVFSSVWNGSSSASWLNGANQVNGTISTAANSPTSIDLGGYFNNAPYFYGGDVAEVIIYNSALSVAERQSVETYLYDKWFGVPEPSSAMLLGVGGLLLWRRHRRTVRA